MVDGKDDVLKRRQIVNFIIFATEKKYKLPNK